MGTYTTHYNLFMPTVGETGWGTLVNENFETIDTTMNGLDLRVGTLETTIEVVTSAIEIDENKNVTFYGNVSLNGIDGNIMCASIDVKQINLLVTCNPSGTGDVVFNGVEIGQVSLGSYTNTVASCDVDISCVDFVYSITNSSGINIKADADSYTAVGYTSSSTGGGINALNLTATYADGSTKLITSSSDEIYVTNLVRIAGTCTGSNWNTNHTPRVTFILNAIKVVV